MRTRQEVCAVIAGTLFLAAAGMIETQTVISFLCLAAMLPVMIVGRLDSRRVTCRDIERRYGDAKN